MTDVKDMQDPTPSSSLMGDPVAWWWEDKTGCLHLTLDRPDVFKMARDMFREPQPLYSAPKDSPVSSSGWQEAIKKIADVATAVGWQANEPAMELAGQIVSILAANPEHIDRFMAEGHVLFLDGTFNHENGSLTYRSGRGDILSPSILRQAKGSEQ